MLRCPSVTDYRHGEATGRAIDQCIPLFFRLPGPGATKPKKGPLNIVAGGIPLPIAEGEMSLVVARRGN